MTLQFNNKMIFRSLMAVVIITCMFQQQIMDGTSSKNEIIVGDVDKVADFSLLSLHESVYHTYLEIGEWNDTGTV